MDAETPVFYLLRTVGEPEMSNFLASALWENLKCQICWPPHCGIARNAKFISLHPVKELQMPNLLASTS
jgi:hypothetical protein